MLLEQETRFAQRLEEILRQQQQQQQQLSQRTAEENEAQRHFQHIAEHLFPIKCPNYPPAEPRCLWTKSSTRASLSSATSAATSAAGGAWRTAGPTLTRMCASVSGTPTAATCSPLAAAVPRACFWTRTRRRGSWAWSSTCRRLTTPRSEKQWRGWWRNYKDVNEDRVGFKICAYFFCFRNSWFIIV